MVELKDIAKKIEDILNTNSLGKTFRIFSDSGELAKRNGHENEYRNGLVEIVSSTISNLSGLQFINMSVNLTLYANEEVRGKNSDGNSIEIIELRQILGDFLDSYNFKTFAEEFGEATYSTTYVIGATTTLPKGSLGYINDCVPLITNIGLTFFENGVNSNEWIIEIDGEEVGYTNAVISRTKTAENQPLAESKSTKSVMQTNGFGLDLVVPQISNSLGNAIEEEILTGKEYAHMVYVKGKNTEQTYICVFGNLQASLIKNANVGFNVPLVEGVPELLEYDERWFTQDICLEVSKKILVKNINGDELVIFWGDGSLSKTSEETITHTFTEDFNSSFIAIFNKIGEGCGWVSIFFNTFVISYILNGGYFNTAYPELFDYDTPTFSLVAPIRNGYTFIGWSGTGIEGVSASVEIEQGTIENKEFEAHWDIINYDIEYTLNGGSVSGNPISYNVESDSMTLNNPTRNGYTFIGWSGTGIEGTTLNAMIPSGSFGNRTYAANWNIISYSFNVDLDGGIATTPVPTTYNVETASFYLTREMFEKENYDCVGFRGTEISGVALEVEVPKGSTGNRDYTVQWRGKQYTLYTNGNGGQIVPLVSTGNISVHYNEPIGNQNFSYQRSGFYFHGYTLDGVDYTPWDFNNIIWTYSEDKTAYAIWKTYPLGE